MRCSHSLFKKTIDAQRGFTLLELLVTISILGILAALLLPVLSKAKDKGRQAACQNNLHQIAIGFQLYYQESDDEFPAPGSKTEYGPQPEDWIWWEQDHDVNQSSITGTWPDSMRMFSHAHRIGRANRFRDRAN